MPVLKLSYYHLPPPLKSCFSYCAIFPKDHEIRKEALICQWMAQGFLASLDMESIEDAGDECFMTLLQRCFFQDVKRDVDGEILSCKMHDLMHDVALQVAGTEISMGDPITSHFSERTRHIAIRVDKIESASECFTGIMRRMRTLLNLMDAGHPKQSSSSEMLLSNARRLRVLDLHSSIEKLPSTISTLMHLRYLNLSRNGDLEALPMSITKLHNLQTLNLCDCWSLKELPRDLSKLVNLRFLDIRFCFGLTHMPSGMNYMTCLQKLTRFVVCEESNAPSLNSPGVGKLEDLKDLTNLKGSLEISIMSISCSTSNGAEKTEKGGYLMNKEYLKKLFIEWRCKGKEDDDANDKALLEDLKPHSNVKFFELCRYPGARLASWLSLNDLGSRIQNFVVLIFSECERLQHLPPLSQLPCLKRLTLKRLANLEYVESDNSSYTGTTSASEGGSRSSLPLFPSLETLELSILPKLKGWWRTALLDIPRYSFPHLTCIRICKCPSLTTLPLCLNVEKLIITDFVVLVPESKASVDMIFIQPFQRLTHLEFYNCDLESSLAGKPEDTPWRALNRSLRCLKLDKLRGNLVNLPKGMRHLTSLESLSLIGLNSLERLPEWIGSLSSLQSLYISYCLKLEHNPLPESIRSLGKLTELEIECCFWSLQERCRYPDGQDWHKIQHIPFIWIT